MNKFLLFFLLCTNFVFGQKNRSLTPSALQGVEASEAIEAVTTSVPRTLSYQGLLTQPNGRAIKDGTLQVTFRLFTALEGGSFFLGRVPRCIY